MERLNETDINNLLEKWFNTKQEISTLETKCEKYKHYAEQILNSKNSDTLSSSYYKLKRQKINRNTISRKDVPKEIWNTYSKKSSYSAYYLNEK